MNQDLKIIKKKYGEDMAKLCRELFPTLLETEGLLSYLILDNFEPDHNLYKDIINQEIENDFKNYIYSLVEDVENNNEIKISKTPKELLSDAGYDLYECKSEKEIQSFKKYYAKGEELCTFRGGRLDRCRVFFAVKKDVDKIKRENYKNPQRQDEYGTSVISIQFTKDPSHTLSIKNRYNHRVNNPDATFSNNLDNIIEGLTESFEKEYGLIQQHKDNNFEIGGYVKANDGKYYKYNQEINNIYYCPNNIIIDNFEVKRYEKDKYIVFDYFIFDLVNKEIKIFDNKFIEDSFPDTIKNIEKIEIEKEEKYKNIKIKVKDEEDIKIVLNENNEMIKLENSNLEKVGDSFLHWNNSLQEINLPNLQKVGAKFLCHSNSLQRLTLPNLKEVGDYFLAYNKSIQELTLPNLQEVGNDFLYYNRTLQELNLPNLQKVGDNFLFYNTLLQRLNLPNIREVGIVFLYQNNSLQELNFPNLQKVGDDFLYFNNSLQKLTLSNLQEVGDNFLYDNKSIQEQELNFPNLEKIGSYFLKSNDYRYNVKYNNVRRSK